MAEELDGRVGGIASNGRHLSMEERLQIKQLNDLEQEFLLWLDRLAKQRGGNTRCLAIARTEIQTGVMWAVRDILDGV